MLQLKIAVRYETLSIKTNVVSMNTGVCSVIDEHSHCSWRRVSSLQYSISATRHLKGKLHKSEVSLIDNTLLVVKTENICWNTTKIKNDGI